MLAIANYQRKCMNASWAYRADQHGLSQHPLTLSSPTNAAQHSKPMPRQHHFSGRCYQLNWVMSTAKCCG
jgi:hypothetical protein